MGSTQLAVLNASLNEISDIEKYCKNLLNFKNYIIENMLSLGIEIFPNSDSHIVTAFYRPEAKLWQKMVKNLHKENIDIYYQVPYLEKIIFLKSPLWEMLSLTTSKKCLIY
ncbi:hypothetical protein AAEX28_01410 [Lentisphaerota bacterium WC36G]|nr:hypothetical protein LJT99_04295 [Lentisphaerae bacterium WC36]